MLLGKSKPTTINDTIIKRARPPNISHGLSHVVDSDEKSFLCHMINKASSILAPFLKIRLTL